MTYKISDLVALTMKEKSAGEGWGILFYQIYIYRSQNFGNKIFGDHLELLVDLF
jgi:hypothetical protein